MRSDAAAETMFHFFSRSGCSRLSESALALDCMHKLVTLRLSNSNTRAKFLGRCSSLVRLEADNCRFLSTAAVRRCISIRHQSLEGLLVAHSNLTDRDLACTWDRLTTANLSHTNITEDAVFHLLESAPRLRRLDVSGCDLVRQIDGGACFVAAPCGCSLIVHVQVQHQRRWTSLWQVGASH